MKPEIKELWVADLLANGDKQGNGALHPDENRYCCLGRLCEISGVGHWSKNPLDNNGAPAYITDIRNESSGYLPDDVMYWAELESVDVGLPFEDRDECPVSLVTANDNGCTFAQIADLIRHFL